MKNNLQIYSDTFFSLNRLIKGDGEILEEMVTRDRHMQINKDATRNDGHNYQLNTVGSSRRFK